MNDLVPQEIIESKILLLRGKKVMLDKDLAVLYGIETFNLNKAVKRNIDRFSEDFMFQLNNEEFKNLIFHFGISGWGLAEEKGNWLHYQGAQCKIQNCKP